MPVDRVVPCLLLLSACASAPAPEPSESEVHEPAPAPIAPSAPGPALPPPPHALVRLGAPVLMGPAPRALAWTEDGTRLVIGDEWNGAVGLFDPATLLETKRYPKAPGMYDFRTIAASADGEHLAFCAGNRVAIDPWLQEAGPAATSDRDDRYPDGPPPWNCELAWSRDGARLAVLLGERFRVIDVATRAVVADHLYRYSGALSFGSLVRLADGVSFQAIAGQDVVRFDGPSGVLRQWPRPLLGRAVWWLSPRGRTGVAEQELGASLVDLITGAIEPLPLPPAPEGDWRGLMLDRGSMQVSPSDRLAIFGRWVGRGPDDDRLIFWDLGARRVVADLPIGRAGRALALSPDGQRVAFASDYGLRVVSSDGRTALGPPGAESVGSRLVALAVSAEGARVATIAPELGLAWDVASRRAIARFAPHAGSTFVDVALSADGTRVALVETEPTRLMVSVRDATGGDEISRGPIHELHVDWDERAQAPRERGHGIIAASRGDAFVRDFNAYRGVVAIDQAGRSRGITVPPDASLAVSDDGRWLARTERAVIRVDDLERGASRDLEGHAGEVVDLAFTADGRLVSGATDGTVIMWEVFDAPSVRGSGPAAPVFDLARLGPMARKVFAPEPIELDVEHAPRGGPIERTRATCQRMAAPLGFTRVAAIVLGCSAGNEFTSPIGLWVANDDFIAWLAPWQSLRDVDGDSTLRLPLGDAPPPKRHALRRTRDGWRCTRVTRSDGHGEVCLSDARGIERWELVDARGRYTWTRR